MPHTTYIIAFLKKFVFQNYDGRGTDSEVLVPVRLLLCRPNSRINDSSIQLHLKIPADNVLNVLNVWVLAGKCYFEDWLVNVPEQRRADQWLGNVPDHRC